MVLPTDWDPPLKVAVLLPPIEMDDRDGMGAGEMEGV